MSTAIIEEQKKLFLDALPDSYDKTEGTVVVDFATANALANERFYIAISGLRASLDYRTAEGQDLTDLAINFGIYRKEASYAKGYVTFNGNAGVSIPKVFTVANDTTTYTADNAAVLDATGAVTILVTATEAGTIGNTPPNTITTIPISLSGLDIVTNGLAFDDAIDEETDEELRTRIGYNLQYPPTSGNKNHYFKWATEVQGVGGARVIVKPTGAGSMKVAIVDNNNDTVQAPLISEVLAHIYGERPATSGTLEVVSATPLDIDVAVTGVTADTSSGIPVSDVIQNIIHDVTEYINAFPLDATEVTYASIVKVVVLAEGVGDYTGLTLNGGNSSVSITGIDIPKANNITATV